MESEKRKRRDEYGKRAKGGESTPVADEEEEFSAILKRIRVAVKYLEKAKGGGSKVKVTGNLWRPSSLLEDFQGDNDVNKDEDSDQHPPLDLNLKPAVSKQDN
ncbi:hypothetical protein V6N13_108419 [Hibiscus sabdariffa]|uniref:Uncharacterized protein n=1 Tax=Hibiscus sabdariffa TaxID=183260 RepID=A0ABR2SS63_9ROSI